jgi:hypothetical protein
MQDAILLGQNCEEWPVKQVICADATLPCQKNISVMKPSYDQYIPLKRSENTNMLAKKPYLIVFLKVKKCIYGLLLYAVLGYM